MGAVLCCCKKDREVIQEQYESLVVTKPTPITLAKIDLDSSESDVPLFAPADSDEMGDAMSDGNTPADTEMNLYQKED